MEKGHICMSLKNGQGEEITPEGRFYSYLDLAAAEELFEQANLDEVVVYMSKSVNNPDETKFWNNFVLKKR